MATSSVSAGSLRFAQVDVAPQDTSGADVQDVDKVAEVPRPDTTIDREVTESEVSKDLNEVDTDSQPEDYHLAGVEVPRDHSVVFPHDGFWGPEPLGRQAPVQARLFALPFGMRLLEDGKTLRIGVLWFNGYGANIYKEFVPEIIFGPFYCLDPVDGLLPSGVIFYDLDTATDEISFLGETVFDLWTAESMRQGFPKAMETYGALGTHGSQAKCFSMDGGWQTCLEQWGSAITVGSKEYVLPMCRHTWSEEMGYFALQSLQGPGKGRGCRQREATAYKSDGHESGFVDTSTKLLHLLFARDLDTELEVTIPVPINGDLITRDEALRSGCVDGANQGGLSAYWCGPGEPYYRLYKHGGMLYSACGCDLTETGFGLTFDSMEAYLASESCGELFKTSRHLGTAYILPHHGDLGAILLTSLNSPGDMLLLSNVDESGYLLAASDAMDVSGGWNPSSGWYVDARSSFDTIRPLSRHERWVTGPDGTLIRSDPEYCFAWRTSLVEGGLLKFSYEVTELGAGHILNLEGIYDTAWTIQQIQNKYRVDEEYSQLPACKFHSYYGLPLHGYGQ